MTIIVAEVILDGTVIGTSRKLTSTVITRDIASTYKTVEVVTNYSPKSLVISDFEYTTNEIADGVTELSVIEISKFYRVIKVATDLPARVRLYTNITSQANDLNRSKGTDPFANSGLILDVATTEAIPSLELSPTVDGWLSSGSNVPISITNESGISNVINATITCIV